MNLGVIVHYIPKTSSQSEIKALRERYKDTPTRLIIVVSGDGNLMDNLTDFIKAR
jgi:hypothetical protein